VHHAICLFTSQLSLVPNYTAWWQRQRLMFTTALRFRNLGHRRTDPLLCDALKTFLSSIECCDWWDDSVHVDWWSSIVCYASVVGSKLVKNTKTVITRWAVSTLLAVKLAMTAGEGRGGGGPPPPPLVSLSSGPVRGGLRLLVRCRRLRTLAWWQLMIIGSIRSCWIGFHTVESLEWDEIGAGHRMTIVTTTA